VPRAFASTLLSAGCAAVVETPCAAAVLSRAILSVCGGRHGGLVRADSYDAA
jgi:hypothetical protein